MIFEIQHLASFDGPGVRTVVYLKGCPLHCLWCHNPEGISPHSQLFYNPDQCVDCGECVTLCAQNCHQVIHHRHNFSRTNCHACGKCTAGCLSHALVPSGKTITVKEVLDELSVDLPFFQQGGGLTLSGGEPLMQPEFVHALLFHAKAQGIHTCIETSGFCSGQVLTDVSPLTDLFLFDIKETDPVLHKKFTGVSNATIMENLSYLNSLHKHIILRCPIIPNLNQRQDHLRALALLAQEFSAVHSIELEPYHPIGLAKYQQLGMTPTYDYPHFLETSILENMIPWMKSFTTKPIHLSTNAGGDYLR